MDIVLLILTDKVEALFDVASLAHEFAILGNLDSGFIVDHEDGRDGWKTLRKIMPLFSAKVEHIVEKHLDVGSSLVAEHAAIYSASDVFIATGVGMVEFASMRAPLWKIM
jgi:hypothetical protein